MEVVRKELIGGEGLIYLATRVSRSTGGPEEIAEELNDRERVRRLLSNVIRMGHHSVLEHSLIRLWVDCDHQELLRLLINHKYVEVTLGNPSLISLNPRTAIELLDSEARVIGLEAIRELPMISRILGIESEAEPMLSVEMEKLSDEPLMYSFLKSPHEDPRHGFYAFWIEMSRVASHQFVRHRRLSFTQRSGRVTRPEGFIFPDLSEDALKLMREHAEMSIKLYERLLSMGVRMEDARYILPSALRTAIFVSGRQSDWHHFLKLRLDRSAQAEIRRIAEIIASVIDPRTLSNLSL
ncbi:MAG: FAD-dependent thymidylate synthase [Candidatus Korarchaeum sp.]|jgi:thymidylate synthase (FAD)|nr:FAD-dependent thymidylate synthase [Candidatus Korarchaeum sp.]